MLNFLSDNDRWRAFIRCPNDISSNSQYRLDDIITCKEMIMRYALCTQISFQVNIAGVDSCQEFRTDRGEIMF